MITKSMNLKLAELLTAELMDRGSEAKKRGIQKSAFYTAIIQKGLEATDQEIRDLIENNAENW